MSSFSKKPYSNALNQPNGPASSRFVFGTVYDVNPTAYTVDVYADSGIAFQGVPVMGMYGSDFNRDVSIINNLNYARVLMLQMGSSYWVMGPVPSLNMVRDPEAKKDGINLNETIPVGEMGYGGSDPQTYASGRLNDFQAGRPVDVVPGDKILSLSNGTLLGLFREGIAKLKASQVCQFILYKYKDLARLVARNFEFFSDFGEISVGHDKDDNVGLHLAGGAKFTSETHPSQAKWTVQAWVGSSTVDPQYELKSESEDFIQHSATEDVRLYIRVNDVANAEVATFTMDTKGHIVLSMSGDTRESITKNKKTQIGEDEYKDIVGNKTVDVGEDEEVFVQGDSTHSVGGDKTIAAVGQLSLSGNEGASLVSNKTITISTPGEVNIVASKINFSSGS